MKKAFSNETDTYSYKLYSKFTKLVKLIDEFKDSGCLSHMFDLVFPKICIIGQGSTGKTSIAENLIGYDFLPRGCETTRPLEIKMIHVPQNNSIQTYAEFPYEEGYDKKISDFSSLKQKLTELMQKQIKKVKESIRLNIYSNSCINVTIIDTPGIDPKERITSDIVHNYIKDESTLILYVTSPTEDCPDPVTNDPTFKLIKEHDPNGTRTIGVITKVDLLPVSKEQTSPIMRLRNLLIKPTEDIHLKHGYVCIRNGATTSQVKETLHKEREFFSSHMIIRTLSHENYFTYDTLVEKIKRFYYEHQMVKGELIKINKDLKVKKAECQKEIQQFGTDYINYTNENKSNYITSLLNSFCESVERMFSSKSMVEEDNLVNYNLKESYYNFLKTYKTNYSPGSYITNEEIIKIIQLTEGDRLSGFPESEVIYTLLDNELDILRDELKIYLTKVYEDIQIAIKNVTTRIFCRFPRLMEKIEELTNVFIDKNFQKTKHLCESVAEMNFNYLYIDDKCLSYRSLLDKFVVNEDGSKSLNSDGKEISSVHPTKEKFKEDPKNKDNYYNGLAEYVKILVNHFYSIIVRNLREYIPKSTGNFFIKSLRDELRFYLLTEVSKDFTFSDTLEEDQEVAKKRNFYIDLMKLIKNAEKTLSSDEDIMKAIRSENRKSIDKVAERSLMKATEVRHNESNSYNKGPNTFVEAKNDLGSKQTTQKGIGSTSNLTSGTYNHNNKPQTNQTTIDAYLKDEDVSGSVKPVPSKKDNESSVSFKYDPNTNEIKDMKVNVNMDAETAYKMYQNNKQYLPTGKQIVSGVTSAANYVEKSGVLNESKETVDNSIVTGNKPQPKKCDPLSSFFGSKANIQSSQNNSQPTQSDKKGLF